jgi:thiamine-monophosphate kinase
MAFTEEQFIAWATGGGSRLPVGPGDDAAVLEDGTLVCVDAIVEGVHFAPGTPPDAVARKALGCCLSDVCAMGGVGETVLVCAQLPPGSDGRHLAKALARWARAFDVELAGGDTVAAPPGALALSVTALGRCPEGAEPWLRSGARPGDRLVVSGPLGGSGAGRHLAVRPRADVVAACRAAGTVVHAAIDLSDGLGRDLPRLCAASGVGAVVRTEALPIHADVAPARDAVQAALADGEDFELLLALPPGASPPDGLVEIGRVREGSGCRLLSGGHELAWPDAGYEHVF